MERTTSIREAFNDFLEDKDYQGVRPKTIDFYKRNFDHFLRDTGVEWLEDVTEGVIRSWLLGHRHVSGATLATYDRSLRVTFNWFEKRGYVGASPMVNLPKRRTPRTTVDTFTRVEVQEIMKIAKSGRNPRRDVALVTLLLDTGLRIGEATTMKLEDINWKESHLRVAGKTGPRSVPFGRRAKAALKAYIDLERSAEAPSARHVFLTRSGCVLTPHAGTQGVGNIVREAGIKVRKKGPHTFRHTFAVEFIRAGGDAFTLQRLLGHATLDMTRQYVHLADSDLRAAHHKFAPADQWL